MPKNIDYEIVRIGELNREELIAEYNAMFGREPPASIAQGLLRKVLVYEAQLQAIGGLTVEQKKLLSKALKEDVSQRGRIWDRKTQFKSGTRLQRLWKGKTYGVIATPEGFVLSGTTYKSLSEVARVITGTRWNGHVFFGLKKGAAHAAAA